MFETYIIQPIFNVLLTLYTIVGDFGVAIILFTVLVRVMMWPLLRKQLHQGKVIRKIQPQIKEIRKKNKGNRQVEAQLLSELYKKHGISTFGSIGLLFIQLPVFFGLFNALRSIIQNPERIIRLPYEFVANNDKVQAMFTSVAEKTDVAINSLENIELKDQLLDKFGGMVDVADLHALPKQELQDLFSQSLVVEGSNGATEALVQGPFFEQQLFGVIDLSGRAFSSGNIYWPVMVIAVLAGVFQYFQTKHLAPKDKDGKTIKEIMKEATDNGKEPEQSEISAAMNRKLGLFFAPLITIISATSPSGLALYFASSGLVGLLQQRRVFKEDVDEMELVADVTEDTEKKKPKKKPKKTQTKGKKSVKKKRR